MDDEDEGIEMGGYDLTKDQTTFTEAEAIEHLRDNYRNSNSEICYQSPSYLKKYYRVLSLKQIKDVLMTFESYSLMKASRNAKKYNPFLPHHIRDVFQIDLCKFSEMEEYNDGVKYLLCW